MFLFSHWLKLTLPERNALAQQFNIAKVGPTHVVDNQVKEDGYRIADVESALNVDAIQQFLSDDTTDMEILWDKLLVRMFSPETEVEVGTVTEADAEEIVATIPAETPVEPTVEVAQETVELPVEEVVEPKIEVEKPKKNVAKAGK